MWQTGKWGAMSMFIVLRGKKNTVLLCRKGQMAMLQRVACIGEESEWPYGICYRLNPIAPTFTETKY
jgi:hypothetical protein